MATNIGEIELLAKINTSDYKKDANEINKTNKDLEKSVENVEKKSSGMGSKMADSFNKAKAPSIALAGAIAGLTAGIVAFGFKSVEAYNVQRQAEAKLIQLHKENTGATAEQTKALLDQASALQQIGVIGDEAIINGQAQLATFKLSTDAIKSLTPAMADMVAQQKGVNATGDDFVNVGNLIGKVMEGQVGALGRYGVSFDEASEKILKNGTETEKAAELAKVLANNYGGVNAALRDTPEGKIQSLKNRFGDLQEGVGELVIKAIDPFLDNLDSVMAKIEEAGGLVEFLSKTVEDNKAAIFIVSGAIVAALIPAIVSLTVAIGSAVLALAPFLIAGAAVGALAYLIYDNWDGIKQFFVNIFDGITKAVKSAFDWVKKNWPLLVAILTGPIGIAIYAIIKNFDTIKKVASDVWNWIKGAFGAIGEVAANIIKAPINAILGFAQNTINGFINAINSAINTINKLPGVNIGQLGALNIPMLASGGIITSPTLAMIGEGREDEAVIPLSKLDQMLDRGGSTENNSSITINLQGIFATSAVEQRRVAQQIADKLKEIQQATGGVNVLNSTN